MPRINLILIYPSEIQKNKNTPKRMQSTPSVALLEAACDRVYTSGNRINPIALRKAKMIPININAPAKISLIRFILNDNTSFYKSRKCNSANK